MSKDWSDIKREGGTLPDPEDVVEQVQAKPARSPRMSDALADGYRLILAGRPANPLCTGFPEVDAGLRALGPNEVTILAADAGVGKSTLSTQIAMHGAACGHGGVYLNLEMSPEMYGVRTSTNYSGLSIKRALNGEFTSTEHNHLATGLSTIGAICNRVILGNQNEHRSVAAIKKAIEVWARELEADGTPLSLVVVDHVLQVLVQAKADDKDGAGKERADLLKWIASTFKVHVLAVIHVTRDASKGGKMPTKNDIASSVWFDRHADNVGIFHQWRSPDGTFDKSKKAKLSFPKVRWGDGPFACELEFQKGFFYPWNLLPRGAQ